MEFILPGGGERGQRPAVKTVLQGHEMRPVLAFVVVVFFSHFDGAFDGLRAAVLKKNTVISRALTKYLGQLRLGLHVIVIGNMDQVIHLRVHVRF